MKYPFIEKKVSEDFVKSRITPDFLDKSKKRKENRVRNIYQHIFSRGGYDKLKEKILNEEINQREL